ncbi:MAG: molybdopterin-dependent oxidoreductase, partial [Duodenibacillus sp.]|nr:molybdopterin-dependent oxidoreductase [Duodenibacillus sp.]
MSITPLCSMNRRGFLLAGLATAATAGFAASPVTRAVAAALEDMETVTWTSCTVNCGSRCPLRVVSKRGQIIRIEPENTGADSADPIKRVPHVKACARGRSIRQRIYSPERLKYPMKRVGKRGEGKFERISWDEAV